MANAYCTTEEFARHIRLDGGDSIDSDKAYLAVEAAARQIDRHTGWRHGFWQDAAVVTREFYADSTTCCYVEEGISTTSGLVVKIDDADDGTFTTTLTLGTDFVLLPANAADQVPAEPYTEIVIVGSTGFPTGARPRVQVTAKFGWATTPVEVKQANLVQAETLFKATATGAVQFGMDGVAIRMPALNWSAVALLEGYCKARVG